MVFVRFWGMGGVARAARPLGMGHLRRYEEIACEGCCRGVFGWMVCFRLAVCSWPLTIPPLSFPPTGAVLLFCLYTVSFHPWLPGDCCKVRWPLLVVLAAAHH